MGPGSVLGCLLWQPPLWQISNLFFSFSQTIHVLWLLGATEG